MGFGNANSDPVAVTLRRLTAKFLIACTQELPPCWYRVNSCANNTLPNSNTEAWLPSVSEVFGMLNQKANHLLLACGLIKCRGGSKLIMDMDTWKDLKIEYGLDIDVERISDGKFIGRNVMLVRIGSNVRGEADPAAAPSNFTLKALLKNIRANTFLVPRVLMTAEKQAFGRNITIHMPAKTSAGAASVPAAAAAVVVTTAASAAAAAAAPPPAGVPVLSPPPAVAPPTSRRQISVQIDLDKKDIPVTVQGQNGKSQTWVRVPTSSSLESCRINFQRTNFIPHLLNAVADKNHEEEEAAIWLFMTMARKHPEGFDTAAHRLGYIPNPSTAKRTGSRRRRAAAAAAATSATTPSATPVTTAVATPATTTTTTTTTTVATANALTLSTGQKRKALP